MAVDFAPNWTPRYKLAYRVQGVSHVMTWRTARGTGNAVDEVSGRMEAFLTQLRPVLFASWRPESLSYCAQDSDTFVPTGYTPSLAAGGVVEDLDYTSRSYRAVQTRFEGRSELGHAAAIVIFGAAWPLSSGPSNDFRVLASEHAAVSGALAALSELGGTPITAIDGGYTYWRPYVNVRHNSHWIRVVRRS